MLASMPAKTSSETAAPPSVARRSSSKHERPARARYALAASPLWPPPTTTASYALSGFRLPDSNRCSCLDRRQPAPAACYLMPGVPAEATVRGSRARGRASRGAWLPEQLDHRAEVPLLEPFGRVAV